VVVLLKLAPVPVVGQTPTDPATAETPGPAGKTPWGEPDLQGIWTSNYETPLQRSPKYANKETFTEEERVELDRLRADIVFKDSRPHSRGSEQDVGGAYSAAIFTSHKPIGRRTSMVVDPPDGRIPPTTPEAQKRSAAIREFNLALLQATDTCKHKLPGCEGGKYGPPSPRRTEPPPSIGPTARRTGVCRSGVFRPACRISAGSAGLCSRLDASRSSTTRARDKGGSASSP
jgi:hypothetical protein